MIRSQGRRCPVLCWAVLFATLMGGCGGAPPDDPLAGVPVTPELAALRLDPDDLPPGRADVVADLDLFAGLRRDFHDPTRRAEATDRLHAAWSERPDHFMWPEVAVRHATDLVRPARIDSLFLRPALTDTTTAVGLYASGWYAVGRNRSSGEELRRVWDRRSDLSPEQRMWLALKLAWVERRTGHPDRSLALAVEILPEARTLAGRRGEREVWSELARALHRMSRVDDALHAVVRAERLARSVADETGNAGPVMELLILKADILAARQETDAALSLYAACADTCFDRGWLGQASKSLNRGGILTMRTGQYRSGMRLHRTALAVSLADGDSLNVPRHMMNIARRHRLLGRLDSCRIYMHRAETWVDAYPHPTNRARMPLMQAEYHAHVGDYATVDSLLDAATGLEPNRTTLRALTELHLQIIKDGEERGLPVATYRSIALLDSLRPRLGDDLSDRNILVDLDLHSAGFFTRQGLYRRAAETLARAEDSLAGRIDPPRDWRLARGRGDLARRRGDLVSAEAAYRTAAGIARSMGDADLAATADLLQGAVLIDLGRPAEARAILPVPGSETGRVRNRLAARLLRGVSYLDEDLASRALEELVAARDACTPWSPRDLSARIDLEIGRALALAHRTRDAAAAYADLRDALPRSDETEEDHHGDLRRDLIEAELSLVTRDGAVAGPAAREVLARTCAILPDWSGAAVRDDPALRTPQLVFFCGKDLVFRWDLAPAGPTLRRLGSPRDLTERLNALLADLGHPGRPVVPREMAALVGALGGAPAHWEPETILVIVPDGPLHAVPWAALGFGSGKGAWLDRGPVRVAEAPAPAEPGSPGRVPGRLLALGADSEGADRGGLRHAEREAREVFARWPDGAADLHAGDGGAARLRGGDLAVYDVIHVASHARVYRGEDRSASLWLGEADLPLGADEIRDFDLDARLVYLSCCEAADGSTLDTGRARAALARGFLAAGARTVVAPSTTIDDEAARRFAGRFYERWHAGVSAAAALREAQRSLRDGDPRWSHPAYWAFYLAMGES